jgi:cysteine desulfurase
VAAPVEHPCVLQGHAFAAGDVCEAPVSADGLIDTGKLDELLARAANEGSILVAAQAANNETGVIQPLGEIAGIAAAHRSPVICDAVQAIGKIDHGELSSSDALFFSAHKFGGPKGVGAVVFYRDKLAVQPFIRGGGQERRQRSGTENVAGIAGLAAALEAALAQREVFEKRMRAMQTALEAELRAIAPEAVIFGEKAARLPNTTCFAVPGLRADTLLIDFDLEGIAVSSGSACASGKVGRSPVLEAMGVPHALGDGAIRVSTGWNTEEADIERFLTVLTKICRKRREPRAA